MADCRTVPSGGFLRGDIQVPGDKSISHRALILGALAHGQTTISGFLPSEDCYKTLHALTALGVSIHQPRSDQCVVQGVGLKGLKPPGYTLDCGNSGTTLRLMAGVLAGQSFASTLSGDSSLSSRPMDRIILPLQKMGAVVNSAYPPLSIHPVASLQGIEYTLPIPSAQVKSCLLLAGLYAKEPTIIIERDPSRDHTERLLRRMGADLTVKNNTIILMPSPTLSGQAIDVPGDISSAAFFIAAASMTPGSHLIVRNVGVNPLRTGIISILKTMGADVTLHPRASLHDEPVADIEVQGRLLQGTSIPPEWVVRSIDEFPMIFVVAACAKGETVIHGIEELRTKETDRILAMTAGLRTLGVSVEEIADGIKIQGTALLKGGEVASGGDHRVTMAFAMAGLRAEAPIAIKDCENIVTSFPNFWEVKKLAWKYPL